MSFDIENMASLVKVMAWSRIGDKPLSEPDVPLLTDAYLRLSASINTGIKTGLYVAEHNEATLTITLRQISLNNDYNITLSIPPMNYCLLLSKYQYIACIENNIVCFS